MPFRREHISSAAHDYDAQALKGALQKNPAYVGMVGSRQKVAEIFSKLKEQGVSDEALNSVYTPIGLDIADGTPAEIAIAIIAEMLLVKNKGEGTNCKDLTTKFMKGC